MEKFFRFVRHYFTPHASNNYKARSLHPRILIYYMISLLIIQSLSSFIRSVQPNILGYATDISVEKIISLVNIEREKNSLKPLNLSSELSSAAINKAHDMFDNNYWAHISPTGITPWKFINDAGYNYVYAGENLAKSFDTSEEVVDAWMKSPTHRANILKQEYTDIGLAILNGKLKGEETTLIVEQFGSRVTTEVAAKPPAKSEQQNSANGLPNDMNLSKEPVPVQTYKFLAPVTSPRSFSLLMAEFLLVILFIDSILMWRFKTMRIAGHSLAHILFIGALIGAMGFTGIGAIL
jgi:hypothetical protein